MVRYFRPSVWILPFVNFWFFFRKSRLPKMPDFYTANLSKLITESQLYVEKKAKMLINKGVWMIFIA